MGQDYYVVNVDKKEFLHPHRFMDGLKLVEFGSSGNGTMYGLAALLANSNGRGGGDIHSGYKVIGSWAGDRIVIAGDYAKEDDAAEGEDGAAQFKSLYDKCTDGEFRDVSFEVIEALAQDSEWFRQAFQEAASHYDFGFKAEAPSHLLEIIWDRKRVKDDNRPLHVRLAEAVLKHPSDKVAWKVMLDACLDYEPEIKE